MSVPEPWRLYTVEEAAAILGLHRSTVYRLLRPAKGREPLPHHNIRGTGVRFTAADIEEILAESRVGGRR